MPFLKLPNINEQQITHVPDKDGNIVMTIYTKNGVVHRDDGPAIITSWSQEWYQNGICHREDGPARMFLKHPQPRGEAIIAANGELIAEWHFNGEFQSAHVLPHHVFHQHWHKGNK